jgi:hypothetical protein
MDRRILNQLSQKLFKLQTTCQGKFFLDHETEMAFQELAAEIARHHQYRMVKQGDQLLYLEFLRCFDKIHTFLDRQPSSIELQRMAEELWEMISNAEFEKITQYFF